MGVSVITMEMQELTGKPALPAPVFSKVISRKELFVVTSECLYLHKPQFTMVTAPHSLNTQLM